MKKQIEILKKKFFINARQEITIVVLVKEGNFFNVYVDGKLYSSKPNELFAVQVFNSI